MFIRRDRRPSSELTPLRVVLFFVAAGVLFTGVGTENDMLVGIAAILVAVTLIVGILTQPPLEPLPGSDDEDDWSDETENREVGEHDGDWPGNRDPRQSSDV